MAKTWAAGDIMCDICSQLMTMTMVGVDDGGDDDFGGADDNGDGDHDNAMTMETMYFDVFCDECRSRSR